MSQDETTSVSQDYMTLFVTVLQHAIISLLMTPKRHKENALNDLLLLQSDVIRTTMSPSSPKFFVSSPHMTTDMNVKWPSVIDTQELKRAVSFLMDSSSLMTANCLIATVHQLSVCVKLTGLSATTFKQQFLRHLSTSNLPLFHMVFLLKTKFSSEIFSYADEDLLLSRLLLNATHPGLPIGHRLLCYDWLSHFPVQELNNGQAPELPCIPNSLLSEQYKAFFPTIFDDTDVSARKLDMLSLCYTPTDEPGNSASMILMGCLTVLHKATQYGFAGQHAVALFRTLFTYYKRHHHTSLSRQIFKYVDPLIFIILSAFCVYVISTLVITIMYLYRFVLTTVMAHPKFAGHTVNFVKCASKVTPER
jgi:hypothetical protein